MVKQVSGFCDTGEKMKLWQYCKTDVSPLCDAAEDSIHVIKFCGKQANQQWMDSIEDLKIHLLDNTTPSSTVDTIVYYLQSWRSTDYDKDNNISTISSSLSEAILAQEFIGW